MNNQRQTIDENSVAQIQEMEDKITILKQKKRLILLKLKN